MSDRQILDPVFDPGSADHAGFLPDLALIRGYRVTHPSVAGAVYPSGSEELGSRGDADLQV